MEWLKEAIDKYDIAEDALPLCPAAEEYLKGLKVRLGAYMDILRSRRDEIAEDYPKTAAILDGDLTQLGGALLQKSLQGLRQPAFRLCIRHLQHEGGGKILQQVRQKSPGRHEEGGSEAHRPVRQAHRAAGKAPSPA